MSQIPDYRVAIRKTLKKVVEDMDMKLVGGIRIKYEPDQVHFTAELSVKEVAYKSEITDYLRGVSLTYDIWFHYQLSDLDDIGQRFREVLSGTRDSGIIKAREMKLIGGEGGIG